MSIFFTLILWVFAFSLGQNIDTAVSYYCFHFISWGVGGGVKGGYYLTETLLKYKIYDNTHKLRYFDVAYNDTIGVDKWSGTCMFILFLTNFSTHNTFFYKSPLCI